MKKTAKIIIYISIMMFVLSLNPASFAQDAKGLKDLKGVELNDGTVIRGTVLKLNVYEVKIEDKDGKVSTVKFDDVTHFIHKEAQPILEPKEIKDEPAPAVYKKSAEGKPEEKTTSIVTLARHTFEIEPELSYIKYEESGVMEQKGIMYGIIGSYAYHNKLMLKGEGKFSYGLLSYDGSTWGGTPVSINNITNYMLELRGLVGYDFSVSQATTITPYLGLGYRYLQDNTQQKSLSGYQRESNYLYSPIGIDAITHLKNGWSWGASLEYNLFWKGRQKSYLSNFDSRLNNPENNQNSGYGLRGSLFLKKIAGRVSYSFGPFIRYWDIAESDKQPLTLNGVYIRDVYEPKNNSTEVGLKFIAGY